MKDKKIIEKPDITVKVKGDTGIYNVWGIDWLNHKMLVERACGYEQIPFEKLTVVSTPDEVCYPEKFVSDCIINASFFEKGTWVVDGEVYCYKGAKKIFHNIPELLAFWRDLPENKQ